MDPTVVTTALTGAACLSAAAVAWRRSGILDAVVRMHRDRRRVAIVRQQRFIATGAAPVLPAGSVLTHVTADGCRLTVRTTAVTGADNRAGETT